VNGVISATYDPASCSFDILSRAGFSVLPRGRKLHARNPKPRILGL